MARRFFDAEKRGARPNRRSVYAADLGFGLLQDTARA